MAGSKWNDFQKANAGKGLTPQQMSAAYRSSGSSSSSASSSSASSSRSSAPSASYAAPPRAAPTTSSSSSSSSSWNTFQQQVAGQGYSRQEVSAMYRVDSTPARSAPAPSTRPVSSSSTASSSSGSAWNEYQREHAGQGLSQTQMAAAYRAEQSSPGDAAARRAATASAAAQRATASAAAATQRAASTASTQRAAASASASTGTSASSTNAWNQYRSENKGKGMSPAEMAAGYQATRSSNGASTTSTRPSASSAASAWNEFQRQHAGQGLSKRQMSLLFKHEKEKTTASRSAGAASSTTTRTTASTTSTATMPARAPNAFNEFQKQYKKDHPNEKLSAAQLAKIYRQQQHDSQRQAHETRYLAQLEEQDSGVDSYYQDNGSGDGWSNAMDDLLAERRQELDDLMLEIAMRQEQLQHQTASAEEYEELARVAEQLEAEEGNLNRKAYVSTHEEQLVVAMSLDNPAEHARYARSLNECEVIDLSRLELTMDDANRIGSGAFGTVYTGVLDSMVPVAVKIVDGVSAKAKARFEQELLVMMKASAHENVLRVYGYAELTDASGRPSYGIVMELMAGGDLAFALHNDESVTLEETDKLELLLQVIKSIEYLHSQGITHRDIKPQNVLLSSDLRTAKLADFGLAGVKNTTLSTRQSHVTEGRGANAAMGLTPAYAAPEVIEGKLSFRDTAWKKSDVFSFTVLLTQVLTGEQPWEFEAPQYIMNSVSKEKKRPFEPEDLVVFGGKAGNAKLHALVRDGWQQDPENRPTATEMRERLEQIITSGATKNGAPSSPQSVDSLWGEQRNGRRIVYDGDAFFDAA